MSDVVIKRFIKDFKKAEKLFTDYNFQESLNQYEKLNEKFPNNVSVINNIALNYEKLDNLEKSLELYLKCLKMQPNEISLIHNVANTFYKLNKYDQALPYIDKLLKKNERHELNSEKYAICLHNCKLKNESKEFIMSVIKRYPENKILNTMLGKSLLNLDSHKDGLKYIQKGSGFIQLNTQGVSYLS